MKVSFNKRGEATITVVGKERSIHFSPPFLTDGAVLLNVDFWKQIGNKVTSKRDTVLEKLVLNRPFLLEEGNLTEKVRNLEDYCRFMWNRFQKEDYTVWADVIPIEELLVEDLTIPQYLKPMICKPRESLREHQHPGRPAVEVDKLIKIAFLNDKYWSIIKPLYEHIREPNSCSLLTKVDPHNINENEGNKEPIFLTTEGADERREFRTVIAAIVMPIAYTGDRIVRSLTAYASVSETLTPIAWKRA